MYERSSFGRSRSSNQRNIKRQLHAPLSVRSMDATPNHQDLPPPFTPVASSSMAPANPVVNGIDTPPTSVHFSTFTRSGAAARFHSSRPVRLRFLLRAAATPSTPLYHPLDASNEQGDCPISQHTVLNHISFTLEVFATFLLHPPPLADRPPRALEEEQMSIHYDLHWSNAVISLGFQMYFPRQ